MLRYQLLGTVILTGALVVASQAQGLRGVVNQDAEKNAPNVAEAEPVMDDDGGRVFIVRRNDGDSIDSFRYHGGTVISEPRQYNIFLGDAWTQPRLQGQETGLANLLSKGEFANDQPALEKYGVRNRFLPSASQEQPFDFSTDQTISDLRIHSLMETWFRAGKLAQPDPSTIYVLFLPPGVSSKLGTMFGGKHFAAYHNFFNAEPGEIHYVVVPYDSDVKISRQAAARALLRATLNPRGDGWY
jgi:hypothetical protein